MEPAHCRLMALLCRATERHSFIPATNRQRRQIVYSPDGDLVNSCQIIFSQLCIRRDSVKSSAYQTTHTLKREKRWPKRPLQRVRANRGRLLPPRYFNRPLVSEAKENRKLLRELRLPSNRSSSLLLHYQREKNSRRNCDLHG